MNQSKAKQKRNRIEHNDSVFHCFMFSIAEYKSLWISVLNTCVHANALFAYWIWHVSLEQICADTLTQKHKLMALLVHAVHERVFHPQVFHPQTLEFRHFFLVFCFLNYSLQIYPSTRWYVVWCAHTMSNWIDLMRKRTTTYSHI